MALWSTIVDPCIVEQCRNCSLPDTKDATVIATRQLCYCGAIEIGERRLGNVCTIQRSTLRNAVQNYTQDPSMERAINGRRFFECVEARVAPHERYARAAIGPRTEVDIASDAVFCVDGKRSPVALVYARMPPHRSKNDRRVELYEQNAVAAMVPLGAEAMHGTSRATNVLCERVGASDAAMGRASMEKSGSRRSSKIDRMREEYGLYGDDDDAPKEKPKSNGKRKKRDDEADEVDEVDDEGDSEPANGISVMDTDDDEDEDDFSMNDEDVAFIADESDDESESASEQSAPKRRRRGQANPVISNRSDTSDDGSASEQSAPKRRRRGQTIPVISNRSDTSDDDFNAQSDKIEVLPTSLEQMNPVPEFDGHCELHETGTVTLHDGSTVEADHTYTVDGEIGFTSTTTDVGQYMEDFEGDAVALRMVRSRNWPKKHDYYTAARRWATVEMRTDPIISQGVSEWTEEDRNRVLLFTDGTIGFDSLRVELGLGNRNTSRGMVAAVQRLQTRFEELQAKFVVATWNRWRDMGTEMHERIEFFFEPGHPEATREQLEQLVRDGDVALGQFLRWYDEWLVPRGYEPFRMELRIFCREMRLCGSVDALFRHRDSGHIIMVDWKRSRGVTRDGFDRMPLNEPNADGCLFEWHETGDLPPWVRQCTGVFAKRHDTTYTKYFIQQCIYRWLIEHYTSIRIHRHYLLVCHPSQGERFDLMPLDYDPDLIGKYVADRMRRIAIDDADLSSINDEASDLPSINDEDADSIHHITTESVVSEHEQLD